MNFTAAEYARRFPFVVLFAYLAGMTHLADVRSGAVVRPLCGLPGVGMAQGQRVESAGVTCAECNERAAQVTDEIREAELRSTRPTRGRCAVRGSVAELLAQLAPAPVEVDPTADAHGALFEVPGDTLALF